MGMPVVFLDFQSLVGLAGIAFVVMRLIDALIKPIWEHFGLPKKWYMYLALAIGAPLIWFTDLNIIPVFGEYEIIGRVLTCLAGGLGPSIVYDLWFDRPKPPAEEAEAN